MNIAIAILVRNDKNDVKNEILRTRPLVICASFAHRNTTRCIAIQSHNGWLLRICHCVEKVTTDVVALGIRNPYDPDVGRIRLSEVIVQILKGFPLIHPEIKNYLMVGNKQQLESILGNIVEPLPLLRLLLFRRLLRRMPIVIPLCISVQARLRLQRRNRIGLALEGLKHGCQAVLVGRCGFRRILRPRVSLEVGGSARWWLRGISVGKGEWCRWFGWYDRFV